MDHFFNKENLVKTPIMIQTNLLLQFNSMNSSNLLELKRQYLPILNESLSKVSPDGLKRYIKGALKQYKITMHSARNHIEFLTEQPNLEKVNASIIYELAKKVVNDMRSQTTKNLSNNLSATQEKLRIDFYLSKLLN